jgi:hypothetical protein
MTCEIDDAVMPPVKLAPVAMSVLPRRTDIGSTAGYVRLPISESDRAAQAAAFRVNQDDDVDRTCQNLSSRRAFSVVSLAN